MKKTILGIILFVCISAGSVLLFSSFKTSTQGGNILVVQVYEVASGMIAIDPKIVISDGTKIVRTVALEVSKGKGIESNLLKIATTLNEVSNEGYSIVASNSNSGIAVTTYMFEKK